MEIVILTGVTRRNILYLAGRPGFLSFAFSSVNEGESPVCLSKDSGCRSVPTGEPDSY